MSQTEEQVKEWLKCRQSLLYFATEYVWLQDRAQKKTLRFESWPHVVDLLGTLLRERTIIIGKARQVAASWTIGGIYACWLANFFESVKVLMLSLGQKEAQALLGKTKFIHDHLPDWLAGATRNPDSTEHIGFPETGSEIEALPSTARAGRSTDATLVISDEAEFHEFAAVNFASIRPTISGGGQHVILSTADPEVTIEASWFKQMYNGAPENDYFKIFFPWHIRPGRDEAWLLRETKGMTPAQAAGEYPATEEDMLATLKTMPYFSKDVLKSWLGMLAPIVFLPLGQHKTVKVWKPPIVGRKYIVYTDPSDGMTDPHVTICKDAMTGEWVATSHGFVPGDYCAQIHHDIVMAYNQAFNSYEANAIGGGIFKTKLPELETPNQCARLTAEGEKKTGEVKLGQWTGEKSKRIQREKLEEFIRMQRGIIYDDVANKELQAFYRPEGKEPQHPKGGHDDWISAGGGVEWIAPYAVSSKVRIASGKYKG